MSNIRIVIADDHVLVREGVRLLLQSQPDMEVVAEASNGREAVEKTGELLPDIVLMDIAMPEMNGLEATGSILTNKYSEGYSGRRYYEGQRYIDQIETLVAERARTLFGAGSTPTAGPGKRRASPGSRSAAADGCASANRSHGSKGCW